MICGRFFRPDVRSRRHQRTCSRQCRRQAKRERDREHKRRYRQTGLGREQRRRERERLQATQYLRFWRKANAAPSARLDRQAARDYYERHREAILRKRREQRARQKGAREARSQ